jgi:hypothetical protein
VRNGRKTDTCVVICQGKSDPLKLFYLAVWQGKSDPALERHLSDLRIQIKDQTSVELLARRGASGTMLKALSAAIKLASMVTSVKSQDTIQQAMTILDAVNKQLYGMLDTTSTTEDDTRKTASSNPRSRSPDLPRAYRDPDDRSRAYQGRTVDQGHGGHLDEDRLDRDHGRSYQSRSYAADSSVRKRSPQPGSSSAGGLESSSSRQAVPSKRFHFGL